MEAGSEQVPNHEDEPNVAASAEPAPAADEPAAAIDPPAEGPLEPPDPPNASRRRVDQVALALLAGIVVLLLICVIIIIIAWRHAPVNPAIPAAFWRTL